MFDDYIFLNKYENSSEAFLLKSFLNSHNIRVVVADSMMDFIGVAGGHFGTRLLVHKDDYDKALILIQKHDENSIKDEEQQLDIVAQDNPNELEDAENSVREVDFPESFLSNKIPSSPSCNDNSREKDVSTQQKLKCPECESIDITNVKLGKIKYLVPLSFGLLITWLIFQAAEVIPPKTHFNIIGFLLMLLFFLTTIIIAIIAVKRKFRCNNCGHTWKI